MCFCPGALVLFRAFLKKWELAKKRFEGAKSVDGLPSVSCLRVGRWKIWKNTMCEVEQLLKLELFLNNYLLLLLLNDLLFFLNSFSFNIPPWLWSSNHPTSPSYTGRLRHCHFGIIYALTLTMMISCYNNWTSTLIIAASSSPPLGSICRLSIHHLVRPPQRRL